MRDGGRPGVGQAEKERRRRGRGRQLSRGASQLSLGTGGEKVLYGGEGMEEKEWTEWIMQDWPEKSAFKAGGPHTRMPFWVRLLELAGTIKGKQEQLVLKVLDLGLKLGFGPVDHNVMEGGRPGQAKRLAAGKMMASADPERSSGGA